MLNNPNWKPQPEVKIADVVRKSITSRDLGLLLRVREDLISGKIKRREFNMETFYNPHRCGTAACIGGWMALYSYMEDRDLKKKDLNNIKQCLVEDRVPHRTIFHNLYYPYALDFFNWEKITRDMAVMAIDNFLAGDEDPWAAVAEMVRETR